MQQNDERERAKARIRALAAKTVENGCTDAEAFAAAEMVGRLLDRYMLTMTEVQVRASTCVQRSVPMAGRRRGAIDGAVPAIARFCHCMVWVEDAPPAEVGLEAGKRYAFFGFEPDVEMALYLHQIVARAIETEAARFRAAHPGLTGLALRRGSHSFRHGLASRVAERLAGLQAEREAEIRMAAGGGTALVVAKQAVVASAFAETSIRLRSRSRVTQSYDRRAFSAGQRAGEGINLSRPVHGGARGQLR